MDINLCGCVVWHRGGCDFLLGQKKLFRFAQKNDISERLAIRSGKRLHNYGKSPFSMGKSTISMAIFNSYVKLSEGRLSEWWITVRSIRPKSHRGSYLWEDEHPLLELYFHQGYQYQDVPGPRLSMNISSYHGEIPYVPLFPPVHCAGRHPKSSETMTTSLDADSESLVVFFGWNHGTSPLKSRI